MRCLCLIGAIALAAITSTSAAISQANVVATKGSVKSALAALEELVPVRQGSTITVGSTIQTGETSEVLMSAFPGSAVRILEQNSTVLAEADLQKNGETVIGRKAMLNLRKGAVQVALDKAPGNVDFSITTPQCVAAARGTVFQTAVINGATTTTVSRGTVSILSRDAKGKLRVVVLKAGMTLTVRRSADGTVQLNPVRASKAQLAALFAFEKQVVASGLVRNPSGSRYAALLDPANPANISGEKTVSPHR